MKVLMLNGSSHINGTTMAALTEVGKALEEDGIEYEIFQIGGGPIADCLGCGQCTENGCIFSDDAVNAFVDLVKKYGQEEYDFSLRETQTYKLIEDVAQMRSEIGILFLNDFNEKVIRKILKSSDLEFHLLFVAEPHVFISRQHPLAKKKIITNEELADYPYLSYEQGEHNSFYFSEEIFSSFERKKNIRVSDRATLFNLLIGLNGYTVCSGIIDQKLNGEDIIAVPLADEGDMRIGYVTHRKGMISRLGETYLEALKKYITGEQSV